MKFCCVIFLLISTTIQQCSASLPEIVVYANGSQILNITLPNIDMYESQLNSAGVQSSAVARKYQYTITINQLRHTTESDTIKESAKIAAQTAAIVKNPIIDDMQLNNAVITLVFLNTTNPRQLQQYTYLMIIDPVIVQKRPVIEDKIMKNLAAIKFVNDTSGKNGTAGKDEYDSHGAKIYIWVIMTIYSTFVLFLLILRVKPTLKIPHEEDDRVKAERLLRSMQEHTVTRNILEQLKNETYRKKIWQIYNSDREQKNEAHHNLREENTIKSLHKKLENMNRLQHDIEREPLKIAASSATPTISTLAALSVPLAQTAKMLGRRNNYQIGLHRQPSDTPSTSFMLKKPLFEKRTQTTTKLKDWARGFESKFRSKFHQPAATSPSPSRTISNAIRLTAAASTSTSHQNNDEEAIWLHNPYTSINATRKHLFSGLKQVSIDESRSVRNITPPDDTAKAATAQFDDSADKITNAYLQYFAAATSFDACSNPSLTQSDPSAAFRGNQRSGTSIAAVDAANVNDQETPNGCYFTINAPTHNTRNRLSVKEIFADEQQRNRKLSSESPTPRSRLTRNDVELTSLLNNSKQTDRFLIFSSSTSPIFLNKPPRSSNDKSFDRSVKSVSFDNNPLFEDNDENKNVREEDEML